MIFTYVYMENRTVYFKIWGTFGHQSTPKQYEKHDSFFVNIKVEEKDDSSVFKSWSLWFKTEYDHLF